jgi:hypothetical protein
MGLLHQETWRDARPALVERGTDVLVDLLETTAPAVTKA